MGPKVQTPVEPPPPTNELLFRTIKIIDIGYITVLYFVCAYFPATFLDSFFSKLYGVDFDKRSDTVLIMEVVSQIICIGIVAYVGRNLVQLIPFPLDGINGFVHSRVKELSSGAFFTVFLVMFQYTMQDKLTFIKNRRNKEKDKKKE